MKRTVLSIAGSSGMGIESSGEIMMRLLAARGYWISSMRAYPSLIKGGLSVMSIQIADEQVRGTSNQVSLGIGLGKIGLERCLEHVVSGGCILHNFERREIGMPDLKNIAQQKNINLVYVPCREVLKKSNFSVLFENTIVLGTVARLLDIPFEEIKEALFVQYGKKQALREANLVCLEAGYAVASQSLFSFPILAGSPSRLLLDGNTALTLGAIHAGVRAYYAYPMSPSSSILTTFAATAVKTGVVVKQAEDEITAAQLTIGSMYAGTRALTGTSGGGFDLMTESVSLAGMIEVPFVVVLAQRPGPATGLPTWTAQSDLRLAIHGGHGEFARVVVAVSDQQSAFELIQHAFNVAELFQIPVVVLTEKEIAENIATVPEFTLNHIPIERNLVAERLDLEQLQPADRYALTESGVSKRRIPGTSTTYFYCNGDEHHEDGTLDESPATAAMIHKRIKKLSSIEASLPEPVRYGDATPDHLFIGRGSTKMVMLDVLEQAKEHGKNIAYLHVERLRPLKKAYFADFFGKGIPYTIIENNATGQLATVLQQELGIPVSGRLNKRNGRQWTVEEVWECVEQLNV